MADAKKHEESAGRDAVAPEAGSEIADDQLEGVAGGADDGYRCPICGGSNYFIDGANHIIICEDCMA